jgi:hypothetical protein
MPTDYKQPPRDATKKRHTIEFSIQEWRKVHREVQKRRKAGDRGANASQVIRDQVRQLN